MRCWLLDTGPIVAYLDSREAQHGAVAVCLESFDGQLITSSAVVVEAMHFVSAFARGPRLLAEFLTRSRAEIHDLCQAPELAAATTLMDQYADMPMDFADATLVLLAEALGVPEILTLDRRGFATFRTPSRAAFRLVLDG